MPSRLLTVAIFLFCGTMTTLLVRSVLYPENSQLSEVAPNVPFDLFVARTEGSNLDIWEANKIIGQCNIRPSGPKASGPKVRKEKMNLWIDLKLRLGRTIMDSDIIQLNGDFWLHSDGSLDAPSLTITFHGSNPQTRIKIDQPAGEKWPTVAVERGSVTLFKSTGGLGGGDIGSQMLGTMLQAAGIPPDVLESKAAEAASTTTVRTGHIEAGGETFNGYLLSTGGEDTRFSLYLSNTGEILRIHTPFSGKNELGLRLLSENLRPKDTPLPNLEIYKPASSSSSPP